MWILDSKEPRKWLHQHYAQPNDRFWWIKNPFACLPNDKNNSFNCEGMRISKMTWEVCCSIYSKYVVNTRVARWVGKHPNNWSIIQKFSESWHILVTFKGLGTSGSITSKAFFKFGSRCYKRDFFELVKIHGNSFDGCRSHRSHWQILHLEKWWFQLKLHCANKEIEKTWRAPKLVSSIYTLHIMQQF